MVTALVITKDNIAHVHCDYEERESAKALGARWDKSKKISYFPYLTYDIMKTLVDNGVPLDIKAEEIWKDLKFKHVSADSIKRASPTDLPNYKTKDGLYAHQKKTSFFGQSIGSYADLSDCGTGKTISTLSIIAQHTLKKPSFQCLVIAPKSIILSAWCEDAKMFDNIKTSAVVGTKKQKIDAFNVDANVYVTNYETMNQDFNFSEPFDMLV